MTAIRSSLRYTVTNRLIGMDQETSISPNKKLLKQQMRHKKIEILEVRVKMLILKQDIIRINIDLLQNKERILFLENSYEQYLQNEHSGSSIIDKSVNLEKYIVEKTQKVDKFDIAKHTITKLTNMQTPVKLKDSKMTKLLANNMINEDTFINKKSNIEIEEMWLKNKCVLDNNYNCSQQILTIENKIQQIIEEFENECEQLHLSFNSK